MNLPTQPARKRRPPIAHRPSAAAMRTFRNTESSDAVVFLAATLRSRSDLKTQFWVVVIYPTIAALIAYVVAALGLTTFVIENLPAEIFGRGNETTPGRACSWLRSNFWRPPLVVAVLFLLWYLSPAAIWQR